MAAALPYKPRPGEIPTQPGVYRFRDADGRNAQNVTRRETSVGLGPLAVHPHLPGTQDAVDHALGHPFEQGHQGVVDPLPVPLRTDLDLTHPLRYVGGSYRLH